MPSHEINPFVSRHLSLLIPSNDQYLRTHSNRFARTLTVLLDQKPHTGKLLEVGNTPIIPVMLHILEPRLEVHVTDYDLTKAPKGRKTIQIDDYVVKVPTYRVNLETTPLPVEDETFDYILCSEVIEHMEQDPMFMLSELNRVLKPGGTMILTTPNVASSAGIKRMLQGIDPYFYMQYRHAGTLDRHNYEYTIYSLTKVLQAAGFDGSAWTEDTFGPPTELPLKQLRDLGFPLNHLGNNIFTVSRKIGPVVDRYPSIIYVD